MMLIKKLIVIISALILFLTNNIYRADLSASNEIFIDEIELPAVNRLVLKNGSRIFYIRDDLPRFTISVSIGFGKLYEMETDAGISDLFANALSLSGSKKYPAQALHDAVENIGGRFDVQSSWEDTVISLKVLDRYYDLALNIIEDILKNPEMNPELIEKARLLLLEDIRRKQDSPEMLAFEKVRNIIYNGDGYGAIPTEKSVKSLSGENLKRIIDMFFSSQNIIIGMSGPMEFKTIEQNIKERFTSLKKGIPIEYEVNTETILKELPGKSKNIYFIEKDIPQATVVIGTLAPNINDHSTYSLTLMDYILGGGSFTSRLMHEIRVKRGLAYAVQSMIRFRKNTGIFLTFAQTNTNFLDTTLTLLLENIEEMAKVEVKNEELKLAKDSIKNSYIFEFATPIDLLNQYVFTSYNNLPESYLKNYVEKIHAVTKKDINNSAADLIKKGLITVVVGDKKLIEKLKKFGNVILN